MHSLYKQFRYLAKSEAIDASEKDFFVNVLNRKADAESLQYAVFNLSSFLSSHHGRQAIILIDEYDVPIQYAWEMGYYDDAIAFFRNFYSSALKDNPSLDFAVLTGVLRISKESIFSALNNLKVSSVIKGAYPDIMGFTRGEVAKMAQDLGHEDKIGEIRAWYDGYNFNGHEMYNPWSVLNYFDNGCDPRPYWVHTSGNTILSELLEETDITRERELHALLDMETIDAQVRETVLYSEIHDDLGALYMMLLFSGYLKIVPGIFELDERFCTLQIPNQEVRKVYADEVIAKLGRLNLRTNPARFMKNLLTGRVAEFAEELSYYLETIASYHDTSNRESFYHGFMSGMLALLSPMRYTIHSNKESGYGRFDIAVFPKREGQAGVVMEFKVAENEAAMEAKAKEALRQIDAKDYIAEFRERGISPIWKYGVAFCGKKIKLACG